MKRKNKISYLLNVPGLWWHYEKKEWCPIDYGVCTSRRFKTANSCFKQANILISRGYKPFITRLFRKKGKTRSIEWGTFDKECHTHNVTRFTLDNNNISSHDEW